MVYIKMSNNEELKINQARKILNDILTSCKAVEQYKKQLKSSLDTSIEVSGKSGIIDKFQRINDTVSNNIGTIEYELQVIRNEIIKDEIKRKKN